MLSLLKLPIVIIRYDFVVSGLAASPGAGLCCASEDSRAISNLLEIINKAACLVFLIGMIEQEVFDLLKVACLANVENHGFIHLSCQALLLFHCSQPCNHNPH